MFLPGSSGAINWGGATVNPDTGMAFTNVTNIPVFNALRQNTGGGRPAAVRVAAAAVVDAVAVAEMKRVAAVAVAPAEAAERPSTTRAGPPRATSRAGPTSLAGRVFRARTASWWGSTLRPARSAWRVPLGTLEDDYGSVGKDVGATNIGPSVATRSGLLFIGATADERFRAFDQRTGRKLWEAKMSASGVAGPMTYLGRDGRQYVVIAAGGPGTAAYRTEPQWGYRQLLVAFAIPRPGERVLDIVTPYPRRMPIGPEETWIPQ